MITGLSGLAIKFDHQDGFGNAEEISFCLLQIIVLTNNILFLMSSKKVNEDINRCWSHLWCRGKQFGGEHF